MTSQHVDSLLLLLPVPIRVMDGRQYFEAQACNGLRRWSEHFRPLKVACPVIPETIAMKDSTTQWLPLEPIIRECNVQLIPLPWAYTPLKFARSLPRIMRLLSHEIAAAKYLSFAISGLIGDWASVASIIAAMQKRPYSIWTDNVADEMLRRTLVTMTLKRRVYCRMQLPVMSRLHRYIIRKSALGLFHGNDCFQAYSRYSSNPHCVHDVHIKSSEQILPDDVRAKCAEVRGGQPIKICYAGRLLDIKGPFDWLDALVILREKGVPFDAEWIGGGDLLGAFQSRIRELKLDGKVRAVGFVADRSQLLTMLRESHVMMFCHKTPESPRCLIESLICGTPIMGYRSPYPEDLVARDGGGLFSPLNDVPALARLIEELHLDRPRLATLIEAAAKSGRQFSDDAVFRHRSELIKAYS